MCKSYFLFYKYKEFSYKNTWIKILNNPIEESD